MTYEQMIELEERNGKVSKGLTKEQLRKLPGRYWYADRNPKDADKSCGICLEDFKNGNRTKGTGVCKHDFHDSCLDKWLANERRCPMCNHDLKV
jgi:E3 ubiquitin-protein ligase BIG BROTHER-like protein